MAAVLYSENRGAKIGKSENFGQVLYFRSIIILINLL